MAVFYHGITALCRGNSLRKLLCQRPHADKTEIAHRPFLSTGIPLRFSTNFTPARINMAYGPVHVKAYVIILNINGATRANPIQRDIQLFGLSYTTIPQNTLYANH